MVGMPGMHPGRRDGAARDRRAFSTPPLLPSSFPALGNWLLAALPHSPSRQISSPTPPEKSRATMEGSETEIPSIPFLPPTWRWR